MSAITFKAKLYKAENIGPGALITLPKEASAQLPSRGMVMVEGTLSDSRFRVLLQPDGEGSHWFGVDKTMQKAARVGEGGTIALEIEPTKVWPEPDVPKDLKDALADDAQARARWMDITPMARWDWINWMDLVKQYETRRARPAKLCSMLKAGKRRPCCFNRTLRMPPKVAEPL